jgi:hypothetical protein
MRKVRLNSDGSLNKDNTGKEFFLNFSSAEGPPDTKWDVNGAVQKPTDGDDILFGDNGNDWIVGGTGRDDSFGGWGNDQINEDDNLSTNNELNDQPDGDYRVGQGSYEDRGYGGAGKDVLIANTGGDRLIDWVGEFNSYIVPFAQFGMATVSRTRQPFLDQYLYALSLSDGIDPTRLADAGASVPPFTGTDAAQNGEPFGELGLVDQHDDAWHSQTGPPSDPQAGNNPGSKRDVIRSANYSPGGGAPTGMFAVSGNWAVNSGTYQGSDPTEAVSLLDVDDWVPSYYQVVSAMKFNSNSQGNAYIIFDYVSPTNFKYAGIDNATSQFRIGQRTAAGWVDKATVTTGLNGSTFTPMLTADGSTATLSMGSKTLSYTFTDPLNDGMIGTGIRGGTGAFTSFTVQKLPKIITYTVSEDLSGGVANKFTPLTGTWTATSGSGGRYSATPPANDAAISIRPLAVEPLSYVEFSAAVRANANGTFAGLVFAATDANNFLFAAVVPGTNQVVLGHRSRGVWYTDAVASANINAGTDYTLLVALDRQNVNVVLNGKSVTQFTYNFLTHAGQVGLFTRGGTSSFDNLLVQGDDATYTGGNTP